MGDFLANIERSFIIQHFHQFFHNELLAKHYCGRAFVGAEVSKHPATVLAEDRIRTHQKLEKTVQKVALEERVGIMFHFLAQNISEDAQCQSFYLQILGFQTIQQAIHHFFLIEEPSNRFMACCVGKLIKRSEGDLRSLDDKGKQRLIRDFVAKDMVKQDPNIRDVSFCNCQYILFLTNYMISCCDQCHCVDVIRGREVEFQVSLKFLCEGCEVRIVLLFGHAENVKRLMGHVRIEFF